MIAIVDDDEAVREATESARAISGLQRFHVWLGRRISQIRASPRHIVPDHRLQMPGLSGIDLQDWLIARGHRIPIIFITGYPDENVRIRAMKAGAVGFLSKPYNHDHLLGYLEKALKAA